MSYLARRGKTSRKSLSSFRARETDKTLIAVAEDIGLVPKTSIRYSSRTARNSSCRRHGLLFWPLWCLHVHGALNSCKTYT